MKSANFNDELRKFININPKLDFDELGQLLMLDELYEELPEDIEEFRKLYSHFDPRVIENNEEGIVFLEIINSNEPESVVKHRLNSYFNIKTHFIDNYKEYKVNMEKFKEACTESNNIINEFLKNAQFPEVIINTLKETDVVAKCNDFFDLYKVYKETHNKRIKFEILRKLGLIVMLKRIRRTYLLDEVDFAVENVKKLFKHGLGISDKKEKRYYVWLDSDNKVCYMQNKTQATKHYESSLKSRRRLGLQIYPLQHVVCHPAKTKFGNFVLHMDIRNKFRKHGQISYTSFVEKMVRKNLAFPNMVRDVIGVRLVVETEEEIIRLVKDLESFLGGSSTRKREKNGLNRFGKRRISKYSSEDYYVWKAVYDITLPNPSIWFLNKLMGEVNGNEHLLELLKKEKIRLEDCPRDFVVEVQIQDLSSYLLSISNGSPATHGMLKKKQIRGNSFYKFFPKEIYTEDLAKLRKNILSVKK
ncbi:MAG: hypothetical protein ACQESF_05990 [Nanobdellota archaeon]